MEEKLFIGVADSGEIIGNEEDGFKNDDECQRHIFDVIKRYIGPSVSTLVDTEIHEIKGKSVCVISCKSSPSPIYLKKYRGNEETFFIRIGASSESITQPSELKQYMDERFPSQT